ncbi:MAG: ABC transporter ATP-binding protein [Peptococcaceae bacterium]|nr:ABC transporter ATP-binding protein [Peptococcaceae bacterium]
MTEQTGILITGLSKKFDNIQALDQVTTRIQKGSIFGLIGSNGAGKSTFLRLLAGIYRPDAGQILIDGQPVYENENLKQRIFYISDDQFYFPNSNMEEMARYFSVMYQSFSYETFQELTTLFRLDSKRKLNTFSKGMQKQAHIILALSCRPDYLFCDETFDGLDPVMRQAVKRLLADAVLEYQMTPIIASHNLRELEDICDHIGLLHQGGVVFERELDHLQSNIHKVQCAFSAPKQQDDFAGLDIVTLEQRGSLSILVVRGSAEETEAKIQGMEPLYCELLPLTLEEIFITEMEVLGYDVQQLIY